MKGISTILATILIVIIVVAIIGLTYTFAVGLVGTTTGGAGAAAGNLTQRLQKSVAIVADRCNILAGDDEVKFTIRNEGTEQILASELAAFLNEQPLTVTFTNLPAQSLSAELTGTRVGLTLVAGTSYRLKISAPAKDVESSVTC